MPTPISQLRFDVPDPSEMEGIGFGLGENCQTGFRIYLRGDLGAGKTTLVRGFLRGRGYGGKVKSPTYTLVEPYELGDIAIFHFDLYRMQDEEELLHIGFQDYLQDDSILLLEWPEKANSILETPDLLVDIDIPGEGRTLSLSAFDQRADELLDAIRP